MIVGDWPTRGRDNIQIAAVRNTVKRIALEAIEDRQHKPVPNLTTLADWHIRRTI